MGDQFCASGISFRAGFHELPAFRFLLCLCSGIIDHGNVFSVRNSGQAFLGSDFGRSFGPGIVGVFLVPLFLCLAGSALGANVCIASGLARVAESGSAMSLFWSVFLRRRDFPPSPS